MPLFEYTCAECKHRFEFLVRGSLTPVCPACRSEKVEKQLSVFAVGASSSSAPSFPAGSPCASCGHPDGPGACKYAG